MKSLQIATDTNRKRNSSKLRRFEWIKAIGVTVQEKSDKINGKESRFAEAQKLAVKIFNRCTRKIEVIVL
jgi:hypothetical protein